MSKDRKRHDTIVLLPPQYQWGKGLYGSPILFTVAVAAGAVWHYIKSSGWMALIVDNWPGQLAFSGKKWRAPDCTGILSGIQFSTIKV